MSNHARMKYIGDWVYVDGHMYNMKTKHLVKVDLMDQKDIRTGFLSSDHFQQILASQPRIEYKKAPIHQIVALELTDKCNYTCRYCFEGNSRMNRNMLTIEQISGTLDSLPDNSEIRFFGGEPLLQFGLIKKVVAKYPQHRYSIVTNGSLVTKDIAQFLADNKCSVGLSYDGFGWHETNRPSPGGDSQGEFENAIRLFHIAGASIGISTVITKASIPHLYDIHLEVFDDYPIDSWAYLLAYTQDMTLVDLEVFRENLLGIVEDFPAAHLLRINDLRTWSMKVTGEWPLDAYCGAGSCYKTLSAQGEERFCTFFLREASCFGPSIGAVEVDCKQCSIWNFCHGGCLALNLYGSGETHKSHPFACKKSHVYFEAGLKTRVKVKIELE